MIRWLEKSWGLGKYAPKQESRQYSSYDPWVSTRGKEIADYAKGLRGFTPYGGNLNVGINQGYQSAMDALGDDPLALAGTKFDPSMAQGFIDQYMQASQPALQDIDEQAAAGVNAYNAGAGLGAWGDRGYINRGLINQNRVRGRADVMSNAINRGITTGLSAHQNNITNRLNANNSYMSNAMGLGGALAGIDTGNINRNYMNYQWNQNQPMNRAIQEAGLLSSLPLNKTNNTTGSGTAPGLGQLLIKGGFMTAGAALGAPAGPAGAAAGAQMGAQMAPTPANGYPTPRPNPFPNV